MPPAARVGDKTSHGSVPLSPPSGSLDVLIGNRPAWRALADMHTCPLATGPVPHVGGVVMKGSLAVLINNLPAARMGDMIVEGGPPNTIAEGSESVLIGG